MANVEIGEPPVKEVRFGIDKAEVRIGGQRVLYRHELTFFNTSAIAIDIHDDMPKDSLIGRLKLIQETCFNRAGEELKIDAIAIRNVSDDSNRFKETTQLAIEHTDKALILCSSDPKALESALEVSSQSRPLIYTATKENWENVVELALKHKCPVVVSEPKGMDELKDLVKLVRSKGVEDIVLDPGTYTESGVLADTMDRFSLIRRKAIEEKIKEFGYPIMGIPAKIWQTTNDPINATQYEAAIAALLLMRYNDLAILHSLERWEILPLLILRQEVFLDPRRSLTIEYGLHVIGEPNEATPVLLMSNHAMTYNLLVDDLKSNNLNCYILTFDINKIGSFLLGRTGGALWGAVKEKFKVEDVIELMKETKIDDKVKRKELIIPMSLEHFKADIENRTGWKVLVTSTESLDIVDFLKKR